MKVLQVLSALALLLASGLLYAQTVPVLMLSDIHFDPFHDPAKFERLRLAPVEDWEEILTSADSSTQVSDFAALQQTCRAKGVDTPMTLLRSSLKAEKKEMAQPLFVTVSGDLMAHQFDCRFKTLASSASDAEYSAFASKTVAFIALELKANFPGTPVYIALGNNDSGCRDYAEDVNSLFLQNDAKSVGADVLSASNVAAVAQDFSRLGDYMVELPKPFTHVRLIVLQDIFESKRFTTCNGMADRIAATQQVDWLREQLAAAKAKGDLVWVMAHIPPGIDAYSTLTKADTLCSDGKATLFLDSNALSGALAEYGSTVRLGLFGHTHMDEMRLLHAGAGTSVPIKLVPSISPVDGNNPAFTIAKVDPRTAILIDYSIFSASNQTGVGTVWSREYTYSSTYKKPDFSAISVDQLMTEFKDNSGTNDASKAYQSFYFVSGPDMSASLKASAMQTIWHAYACSLTQMDAASFRSCACTTK